MRLAVVRQFELLDLQRGQLFLYGRQAKLDSGRGLLRSDEGILTRSRRKPTAISF